MRAVVWPALLYSALTIVFAYPLSLHPASRVISHGTDTSLFMWTIAWNAHAIVHTPWSLFDANIFFPFRHSLAFSENLLGTGIIASPVLWITGNPILALNLVALASIPLSAIGTWLLARELKATPAAAVLAGLVAGFTPPRFFRLEQLHLTTVQWIPFCLAFLHAYLERGRARDLRIAIAFFTLQVLTSGHGGVFLAVAILLLLVYRAAFGESLAIRRRIGDVGIGGGLLLAPAVLMLLPYRAVQAEMGLRRTLTDYRIVSWQSFLASPSHVHQWLAATLWPDAKVMELAGAYLFPGVVPLALAVVAMLPSSAGTLRRAAFWLEALAVAAGAAGIYVLLYGGYRLRVGDVTVLSVRSVARVWIVFAIAAAARLALSRRRVPFAPIARVSNRVAVARRWLASARTDGATFYALLTMACVWLSLAPPFGLWEHVYWLPGFDFIRAPSRFMILAVFALGILAAFGFDRLATGARATARVAAALIVGLLILAEFAGMPLGTSPETVPVPGIDRWLATQRGARVVAEVPVENSPLVVLRDGQQTDYMLHAAAHWQKTVHGYSGIRPPLTDEIYEHLIRFPDTESIRALQSIGVDTIVVHPNATGIERRLASFPELQLEHSEPDGRVYSLAALSTIGR